MVINLPSSDQLTVTVGAKVLLSYVDIPIVSDADLIQLEVFGQNLIEMAQRLRSEAERESEPK